MESLDECMQNIVIVIREEEKKSRRVKDVIQRQRVLRKWLKYEEWI
tara:strand:+ start:562 stop:699 length:138 start_codon:yes stop_codon:yes gene_type:complete